MDTISLAHGNGGIMTDKLIDELFLKYFDNNLLKQKDDSSLLPPLNGRAVISTDSFVVNPIFFPGGNIGKLAVCGTVNDLAVNGAKPLYLTAAFILEEGLSVSDLEEIIESMAETAEKAGVKIAAGDTKVVERGKGDKIYINTTGLGVMQQRRLFDGQDIKTGDKIIINGAIGEHGLTIMKEQKEMDFEASIKSDCCLLADFIKTILTQTDGVKFMRDPTRGGTAGVLNEIAAKFKMSIIIEEEKIPLKPEVENLCSILGFDPLYLASEGKVMMAADKRESAKIIEIMKKHKFGRKAAVIGTITGGEVGVCLHTKIGGSRILNKLTGEMLPRIC